MKAIKDIKIIEAVEIKQKDKFISTKPIEIKQLEDCVDLPIKKCVALCNLLGFETTWSCCEFNYEGDKNKDHILGTPQIFIKANFEKILKGELLCQ